MTKYGICPLCSEGPKKLPYNIHKGQKQNICSSCYGKVRKPKRDRPSVPRRGNSKNPGDSILEELIIEHKANIGLITGCLKDRHSIEVSKAAVSVWILNNPVLRKLAERVRAEKRAARKEKAKKPVDSRIKHPGDEELERLIRKFEGNLLLLVKMAPLEEKSKEISYSSITRWVGSNKYLADLVRELRKAARDRKKQEKKKSPERKNRGAKRGRKKKVPNTVTVDIEPKTKTVVVEAFIGEEEVEESSDWSAREKREMGLNEEEMAVLLTPGETAEEIAKILTKEKEISVSGARGIERLIVVTRAAGARVRSLERSILLKYRVGTLREARKKLGIVPKPMEEAIT
jgi:hypothetical protein